MKWKKVPTWWTLPPGMMLLVDFMIEICPRRVWLAADGKSFQDMSVEELSLSGLLHVCKIAWVVLSRWTDNKLTEWALEPLSIQMKEIKL